MTTAEKPLVEVKVTNPVTYLKNWWNKVIANEGVDFRFHIRPLTAIAMTLVVALVGFGVGRFSLNIPFLKYEVIGSPTPVVTTEVWKETAYTGTLQYSQTTSKYYLMITSSSELITLQLPENLDLSDFVGKRILAIGKYNKSGKILVVSDAKSLEILSKSPVPIPTFSPSPSPTVESTPTPEASSSATPGI
jgi:hypothetical protein